MLGEREIIDYIIGNEEVRKRIVSEMKILYTRHPSGNLFY